MGSEERRTGRGRNGKNGGREEPRGGPKERRERKRKAGDRKGKTEDREKTAEERRLEELERGVEWLTEGHSTLATLLAEAEELCDALEYRARLLRRELARDPYRPVATRRGGASRKDALRYQAEEGIFALKFKALADGSASILVNDEHRIPLSPRPAQLLAILIRRDRPSPDRFPPWWPLEEVAEKLEKVTGEPVTRHNVTQIISRLRERLERGGVNRFVVATCRSRGVRFLLDGGPLGQAARAEVAVADSSESGGSGSSS